MAEEIETIQQAVSNNIDESDEDKKKQYIQQVSQIFLKENFMQNQNLLQQISDHNHNSIPLKELFKELKIQENIGQQALLIELLKNNELKDSVVLDEIKQVVSPTWKRLRNIIYFFSEDKSTADIKNYLLSSITLPASEYSVEVAGGNVKVTVNSKGKEEENAKLIFNQFFMEKIQIKDKDVELNCVIEQEQLPVQSHSSSFNKESKPQSHYYMPQYPINGQQLPLQFIHLLQQQQQQFYKTNSKKQQRGGPNRDFNYLNAQGQFPNRNEPFPGTQINNGPVSDASKNVPNGKPTQSYQGNQISKNYKGGNSGKGRRDGKPATKGFGGKSSQRVFSASDKDFPTLQ